MFKNSCLQIFVNSGQLSSAPDTFQLRNRPLLLPLPPPPPVLNMALLQQRILQWHVHMHANGISSQSSCWEKKVLVPSMETFPTFGLNFFLSFLNITSEANTRLGPGCLRSLLGFTMLLSLSCQQHVCWTNIWKMCFLPNFTVFHHARIYCTERCLLKMVLGCFWNFLRTNENNTENQTCYIMNATLTTWTSLKNVAHGEIQWHCHNVNRVTMASTPKPRSCISALTTSLSWRFFETYGNIHFVISCTCMICMRVYDLYWRIQNSNRRNMCEYMQYMCEFENRIKNNTNTPHHYWDDSSHLSCLPLQVHTSCPPFLAVRRNLSKGGKLA